MWLILKISFQCGSLRVRDPNAYLLALDQVADHVRALPGVESVALSAWTLLSGIGSNGFVSVGGAPPHELLAYFLNVSPGWLNTMKIGLLEGRDGERQRENQRDDQPAH